MEKTYRIRADKKHRAIAGLSMDGGGAVAYAQRHPEMFGTVCSLLIFMEIKKSYMADNTK